MKRITGMKKTVCAVILVTACGVGLLAAACGGESTAAAKEDFCNSVSDLSTAVATYDSLAPATATIDELDAAYDDVEAAYDDVVQAAEDWADADDNALAEAYDDLYWAVQTLPGDYTVAESLQALEPELSAFPEAFRSTFDLSGC